MTTNRLAACAPGDSAAAAAVLNAIFSAVLRSQNGVTPAAAAAFARELTARDGDAAHVTAADVLALLDAEVRAMLQFDVTCTNSACCRVILLIL